MHDTNPGVWEKDPVKREAGANEQSIIKVPQVKSLCRMFTTLPCLEGLDCFDGLALFFCLSCMHSLAHSKGRCWSILVFAAQQSVYIACVLVSMCAPDLYIIQTLLVLSDSAFFSPEPLSCKLPLSCCTTLLLMLSI